MHILALKKKKKRKKLLLTNCFRVLSKKLFSPYFQWNQPDVTRHEFCNFPHHCSVLIKPLVINDREEGTIIEKGDSKQELGKN